MCSSTGARLDLEKSTFYCRMKIPFRERHLRLSNQIGYFDIPMIATFLHNQLSVLDETCTKPPAKITLQNLCAHPEARD